MARKNLLVLSADRSDLRLLVATGPPAGFTGPIPGNVFTINGPGWTQVGGPVMYFNDGANFSNPIKYFNTGSTANVNYFEIELYYGGNGIEVWSADRGGGAGYEARWEFRTRDNDAVVYSQVIEVLGNQFGNANGRAGTLQSSLLAAGVYRLRGVQNNGNRYGVYDKFVNL